MHRLAASKTLALLALAVVCTGTGVASAGIINVTDAGQTNGRSGNVSDGSSGLDYDETGSGSSSLSLGGSSASSSNSLTTVISSTTLSITTSTSASASADEFGSGLATGTANQTFTFTVDANGTYRLSGARGVSGDVSGDNSGFFQNASIYLRDDTTGEYLFLASTLQTESTGSNFQIGTIPAEVSLVAGNLYTLFASSFSNAAALVSSSTDGSAFANITLAVIPEPPSLALSGLAIAGMAGFAGWRRRAHIAARSA